MKFQKLIAGGLIASVLCGCMACSKEQAGDLPVAADAVVMTVDDTKVSAADYAAFLNTARVEWKTYLSQYGIDEETYLEDVTAETYGEDLRMRAEEYLILQKVLSDKITEFGLKTVEPDEATVEAYEQLGLGKAFVELQQMGAQLTAYCLAEDGPYAPAEEAVQEKFQTDYLRCKHILVKTVDDNYNELENQEELADLAKDIAERAQAGEDFDVLIQEYNEDPGMTSNPDGYVFTEGTMVTEFYEGTLALPEGGVSEPVKTTYGWHIIQRLPLREQDLAGVREEIIGQFVNMDALLTEWMQEAEVTVEEAAAQINYENCTAYLPSK